EDMKILGADRGIQLASELRHDLTDVAVAVHDLCNREPIPQQVTTVKRRAIADRRAAIRCADQMQGDQRIGELGQKKRDPVLELRFQRFWSGPLPGALPSAVDDSLSIRNDEIVQQPEIS